MRVVAWMVGASVLSWVAFAPLVDPRTRTAVLFGMLGPLAVAAVSWVLAERAYRRNPQSLTPLMMSAFAAKLVFFGAYVTVMLKGVSLVPVPFVVSFVAYFIALHLFEALSLRRLFAS
jgi:hypothetical protein